MKNYLLNSKFFILFYILTSTFILISCRSSKDDNDSTSSSSNPELTQIMYSTNDIKEFKLYSPTSFKFYPWTLNSTIYPGVTFPDTSILRVNSNLSWSSSNENIIKPVEGIMVALNEGEATLNAKWTVSNLSTSSKLTVALPDSSAENYKNWIFSDIDFDNYELISSTYEDTHSITLYWNDPYYLTTAYIIAYSNAAAPTDCTTSEENKTIIELDLSKTDLQENDIELNQEYSPHFMYHYTIRNLDYSKINYFIICKKQTLSITKENKKIYSNSRLTSGLRVYLPIQTENNEEEGG